ASAAYSGRANGIAFASTARDPVRVCRGGTSAHKQHDRGACMIAPDHRVDLRRVRRTARHERIGVLQSTLLQLISALAVSGAVQAQAGPPITIVNALPPSTVCPNGN